MPLDDEAAMAAPLAALDEALVPLRAAAAVPGDERAVRAALEAARLLRIVDLRAPERAALDEAEALLTAASEDPTVPGACEASLDLVRLLARDRSRPASAYEVAYRTVRRFREGGEARCVAEARRVLAVLAPHRPDEARIRSIDADPARSEPEAADGAPSALEAWARLRRSEGAEVVGLTSFGERGAASARVVVTLDGVTALETGELAADAELPRRLVVSLPGARLGGGLPNSLSVAAGGLERVRTAADDAGARISLDLAGDAVTNVYALESPFRVVVDVAPARAPEPGTPARALGLVLLDPGHGGDDYGARAFGLHEADLTLDIAMRVRSSLLALAPDLRVVMTREDDTFVSLEQRAAMANAIGADVFVSIHLNAADEPVEHGGITTFVLDTTNDRSALRLAARENGTATWEVTELQRILAGLSREDQLAGSRVLAERIHGSLLASGRTILPRLHDRGVRSAMFYVLVGATMPAVLVEASFMTREDEADALRSARYRDALAAGIAEGIAAYDD
jgi:N-acetylmuramoyl-L-alanine amidase